MTERDKGKNNGMEVIAWHGWAFDASCWQGWDRFFKDADFRTFEKGYYSGKAVFPEFNPESEYRILLAHSMGLHQLPESEIAKSDLLVIFGGFLSFHPQSPQFKRRSRQVLEQMISRLKEDPQKVLDDFYKNAFYPQNSWEVPDAPDEPSRLIEDLYRLKEEEITAERLKKANKICILHGFDDSIVPRSKGRQLYEELQDKAKYFEVKHTGHALPFTHSEQCWSFIKTEVEHLISDS